MSAPALRLVTTVIDNDTGEIQDCPHCRDAREECEVWERRVLTLERQLKKEREDKDAKMRADNHYSAAIGLIQEWKRECGHPNSSEDDPKRIRLALSVVKRYKGEDGRAKLSLVIQQAKHLAFVDPDTGFKYDEFGRIFGSSDEIEKRATQFYLWRKRNPEATA